MSPSAIGPPQGHREDPGDHRSQPLGRNRRLAHRLPEQIQGGFHGKPESGFHQQTRLRALPGKVQESSAGYHQPHHHRDAGGFRQSNRGGVH